MPVKVVVNPASVGAIRRPPERAPPHRANDATCYGTDRPGDHNGSPDTERRANGIRLRTCRGNSDHENGCASQ